MEIYLDTSALIKLYVMEDGQELVQKAVLNAARVGTSMVAYAEARAGLARRLRDGDFTTEQHRDTVYSLDVDWISYDRRRLSDSVALHAGELAERYALRGFDAIHLASAMRFTDRSVDGQFLAFDRRLTNAAQEAGLTVFSG